MDNYKPFMNPKKFSIKESIKNYLRKNKIELGNLTVKKNDISRVRYKFINKYNNQKDFKIRDNANKLMMKSFNKNDTLEQFIKNINTKKSYSIKLNQKKNNIIEPKNNSLNLNSYNLSLKKRDTNNFENNLTIDINANGDTHFKKNNLFLYFNNNIKKEYQPNKYFKTLDTYSRETINTNQNNNYINNIINININLDKKRKKYRNQLSLTLKKTINYVTENLFNNTNKNGKNIKMNLNLKSQSLNSNKVSSVKSIKSNKGDEIGYNHTISNEIISKNKIRSKNTFIKLLSKNKNTKKNFISIGRLLKSDENNEIKRFKENNMKIINNNTNHKFFLLNNINPIINYNNINKKIKKNKNYFIQKKKSDEIKTNKLKNYNSLKIGMIKNKVVNFTNSPKKQGIKLFLKTSETYNNYINYKPEYVQEYNQEILLNLLMDEYCFEKDKKLTLSFEMLNNYGINPMVRSYLIDSLIGLQDTFKFHDKTLFITLNLFDNYIASIILSKNNHTIIKEAELDLIITSCFLIASKSEESFIYHLTDYLSILSSNYTVNDLITMEYNILKYFNFEAFSPNVLDFFEFFSVFYSLDKSLNKKGIIVLIIILSDLYLSQISSSFLAFSVICFLYNSNINLANMFNKLDSIFDNLYCFNNNNINKNNLYKKFLMLIKPLKNEMAIKNTGERIMNYLKNIKKGELSNISKKLELFKNIV